MMRATYLAATCILVALPSWAIAAESDPPESKSIAQGTFAKAIEKAGPRYPKSALRRGQEGWVELSYVIGPDGQVHDPIIENSSGIRAFEKEALRTVQTWRFEPAMWGGRPVEQSHTKVRLTFAIERPSDQRGASRAFVTRDRKFRQYLEEGDLLKAEKFLSESFEDSGWNLYETTWLWISSYRLHSARSDELNQLKSIRRAAVSRAYVGPDEAAEILTTKFFLEARLGQYADAIETYELLLSEAPTTAREDRLVQASKSIYDDLNSDKILATNAVIEKSGGEGVWAHRLTRRKLVIDSVDGKIKNLDIRCDWHLARDDEPYVGKIWEIPARWGDCRLFVHGGVGTSLRLLELPDE